MSSCSSSSSSSAPSKPAARTAAPQQRAIKPNALVQRSTGDAGRERRRDMFLKKVANDRDERRWAGRAQQVEQIMLLDYKKKERRRREELERSAPAIPEPSDEDDEERDEDAENRDPMLGNSQMAGGARVPNVFDNYVRSSPLQTMWSQNSEAEVEAVAQQEDEELDALLAMMEEDDRRANTSTGNDAASQHYGSDDDEYDNIFSEYLAGEQSSQLGQQAYGGYIIEDDAMDMS
ncbi:hypothetical protein MPH_01233 [Macrophomina phaseolina MS6]|uniref:Uncharacterized protein n=1 Tax=Macrophomina phaseolina (strain MS6) TaxID=1126212 RepID=K2SXY8_MACPH|nr:hypothetical protein MPH_01233 [Macrophomina phaseolina MS6]